MAEYINRERARFEAKRYFKNMDEIQEDLDMLFCMLPAENVAPVRHGRWIHTEEQLGWKDVDCMECSACHDSWIIEEDYCFDDMQLWNYCPSCGAKMDGGED